MHMFYWLGTRIEDFLFEGYNIITTWGFISTCLGLVALSIVYEAMKISQIKLRQFTKEYKQVSSSTHTNDSASLLSRVSERSVETFGSANCNAYSKWIIEVVHWTFHVTLGYLLMLAVMTFNGYISIALVIGSGIGYSIFGPILFELRLSEFKKRKNFGKLEQCNPECADAIVSGRRESVTSTAPGNLESEVNINIDVDVHV